MDTSHNNTSRWLIALAINIIIAILVIGTTVTTVTLTNSKSNHSVTETVVSTAPLPRAIIVTTDSPHDPILITVGDTATHIVGVSAKANGVLDPPADVTTVGWDVHSSQPGSPGVTLIVGHSDDWQKVGAAKKWATLHPGDTIYVKGRNHTQWFYRVKKVLRVSKMERFPQQLVNMRTGRNQIVLVTCTGRIVGGALGHEDNVFVVADLVGSRKA